MSRGERVIKTATFNESWLSIPRSSKMRVEPIDHSFWLRLLDLRAHKATRTQRTCSTGAALSNNCLSERQPSAPSTEPSEPLPQELWEAVFGAVAPGALLVFRAACSAFRERLDSKSAEALWKSAYVSEWGRQSTSLGTVSDCAGSHWRSLFLTRWWAHSRWGKKLPTVSTLMGKKAHGGTVTCVALGECGVDSGEGLLHSQLVCGRAFSCRKHFVFSSTYHSRLHRSNSG